MIIHVLLNDLLTFYRPTVAGSLHSLQNSLMVDKQEGLGLVVCRITLKRRISVRSVCHTKHNSLSPV